jgi:DNA recombination protein RmuC
MSERFEKHKAAADKDLEDRQKAIELLVKPVGESLSKFERTVGDLEKARLGAYSAITEQVKNLTEGQVGLRTETSRLVQALRQPKTRGRWGEYQLRNVLEMAGMTEHVDFIEEQTIEGDGGRMRPDVIVRLPGSKCVVVDAKTPLDAYLAALDASDEATRERHLAEHARQVREHVRALGSKDYWKALPVSPDFVVMFVPGEAFFATAIESDPNLFEQAVRQRVLISTPTTFIALVKAIAYGWQQEKVAENAQAVADLARDLFERIKVFGGYMRDLGRSLQQAVDRYNKGVGSLEGRVLPAARRFEGLGVVPAGSEIPRLEPIEIGARDIQAVEVITSTAQDQAGQLKQSS